MQSLSTLVKPNSLLNTPLPPLKGFPDCGMRSPNDPVYMLSATDTFKLIQQNADIADRSEIDTDHYRDIYIRALDAGWKDVLMQGGQLFFISGLKPTRQMLPDVNRRKVIITVNFTQKNKGVDVGLLLSHIDPGLDGSIPLFVITGMNLITGTVRDTVRFIEQDLDKSYTHVAHNGASYQFDGCMGHLTCNKTGTQRFIVEYETHSYD